MEEKEILFTDSEIEHLRHICTEILANDPTNKAQAQSILQKLSSAQPIHDELYEEIPILTKRRGRKPKLNPAPAEIIPETIPAIPALEPVNEIEKTTEVVLEVVNVVPTEKPATKLKFIQNLLQKLKPAIGM